MTFQYPTINFNNLKEKIYFYTIFHFKYKFLFKNEFVTSLTAP